MAPTGTQPVLLTCLFLFTGINSEYHGKLIGTFGQTQHSVAGTIYAVDTNTIRLIGFSYDGIAPDAFVWGGETGTSPSNEGFIIGSDTALGPYTNEDIELDLPAGKSVVSLAWISIWCRQYSIDFGHIDLPASFSPPEKHDLGEMGYDPRQHNVHATSVVIVNTKQIRFENLIYDGLGPAAYFWAGPGDEPSNDDDEYIVPDETGSSDVLRSYNGETVTVTLPGSETVFDIGHIGLWCITFSADFGHVDIPPQSDLNVPPSPLQDSPPSTSPPVTTPDPMEMENCEVLVDGEAQVAWKVDGNDIIIQLRSKDVTREKYLAFGVSGSQSNNRMVGGDVVVTFVDSDGNAQAIDYYLNSQSQCSPQTGQGSCPDKVASSQANDDVSLVLKDSFVENGVTTITYRRPLAARDTTYDKAIALDEPLYVIWARGLINSDGFVSYHQSRVDKLANFRIDFGGPSSTCPQLATPSDASAMTSEPPVEIPVWNIPRIIASEDESIRAEMGLSGGQIGYEAITGRVGWGVAWFINDLLIPELVVERGRTYTFLVSGGNDSAISAMYHPFYITDDINGGYDQLSDADKENVRIYAGPVEGPLCQWEVTNETQDPSNYRTFEDYRATLTKVCEPGGPTTLKWNVTAETPDLVYYHCYTHRFLGWKILVINEGDVLPTDRPMTTRRASTAKDDTDPRMTTRGKASRSCIPSILMTCAVGLYAALFL